MKRERKNAITYLIGCVFKKSCNLKKSKCCCLNRHIFATKSSISPCRRDEGIFEPRIGLEFVESGDAAEAFGLRSMCGSDLVGNPMKSAIAAHSLPHEHYVVRIDGRVKSHHRRFVDALRDGLFLRDQFPQHDVKVHATHERSGRRTALH